MRRQLDGGAAASSIDIPQENQRLKNLAQMREISRDTRGQDHRPAADAIGDAHGMFHVLFGNNGGDFSGMNRTEFGEVGRLSVTGAAKALPGLEARAFDKSQDPATRAFGKALPEANRESLFTNWANGRAIFPPKFS